MKITYHLILIFVYIFSAAAQTNLKLVNPFQADSTKIFISAKYLQLTNWSRFDPAILKLEFSKSEFNPKAFLPENIMPAEFWKIDYRTSSYYTPRMVSDKLNLIMNRPKDSDVVPIFTAAILAAQLAQQYVFVKQKISISYQNILQAEPAFQILELLWRENPQSATQLYKQYNQNENTVSETIRSYLVLLAENKLIKSREVAAAEDIYFPALYKSEVKKILENALDTIQMPDSEHEQISRILARLME